MSNWKGLLLAALFAASCGGDSPQQPPPDPPPPPPPVEVFLPRLVTEGHVFKAGDNEFTVIGNNDHQLFEAYLNDHARFEAVLEQRAGLGFNMLRVFSMCYRPTENGLVPCDLTYDQEGYYRHLHSFAQALAQKGLYLEFTVFACTPGLMPDPAKRLAHWNAVVEGFKDTTNVILEVLNERSCGDENFDFAPYVRPPYAINASRGAGGAETPPRPWWDSERIHTNDQFEWWRKGGHNGMELQQGTEGIEPSRVPIIENEKTRPDRDGNLNHHYDSAAAATLLIAGSMFHSDHGRYSQLFEDYEVEAARAMVAGAKSVPLSCRYGGYYHGIEMINLEILENLLRAYRRGDDNMCIVKIRR